jgi:hypothetical protein
MGDLTEFAIWVILLALMAFFTWVRKTIEKTAAGKEGQKVDVAKAVQEKLRPYMEPERGGRRPIGGIAGLFLDPAQTADAEPTPASRQVAPLVPTAGPPAPPRLPAAQPLATEVPERVLLWHRPQLRTEALGGATVVSHRRHDRFDRRAIRVSLRHAVIFAEILGPPIAERGSDHRLV